MARGRPNAGGDHPAGPGLPLGRSPFSTRARSYARCAPLCRARVARALVRGEVRGLAPDLVFVEVGNALLVEHRAGLMEAAEVTISLDRLLRMPMGVVSTKNLIRDASAIALARGLSAYDACYVALAEGNEPCSSPPTASSRPPAPARNSSQTRSHQAQFGYSLGGVCSRFALGASQPGLLSDGRCLDLARPAARYGTPGATPARIRPAEPASTVPALRLVGRAPMLPASASVRRGAPDAPARAPEQAISGDQPSRYRRSARSGT